MFFNRLVYFKLVHTIQFTIIQTLGSNCRNAENLDETLYFTETLKLAYMCGSRGGGGQGVWTPWKITKIKGFNADQVKKNHTRARSQ